MKKESLSMIFVILTTLILCAPISSSFSDLTNLMNSNDIQLKKSGWIQEIGTEDGAYPNGFGVSSNIGPRGMVIYDEELYIGTHNLDISSLRFFPNRLIVTDLVITYLLLEGLGNIKPILRLLNLIIPLHGIFCDGCELWKYNFTLDQWNPLVSDSPNSVKPAGFGHRRNWATAIIQPFKGKLYVGTATSSLYGCEIWRYDGMDWERIQSKGFDNRFNSGAWSVAEYKDELFVGTMNWKNGCEIWKTKNGDNWEKVNIPCGDGFGTIWNVYAWIMHVWNNSLYVGTCNVHPDGGCQLWRYDGISWGKMDLPGGDGFGNPANYGIRNMVDYNGELYVSTGTNFFLKDEACEIWKFNGEEWSCVVGEGGIISDGFGDLNNKYAWSMIVNSDNTLWIGTLNMETLGARIPFETTGCEIWRYDGMQFECIIGDNVDAELPGGFGDKFNVGARSMIEYPENSGIVWVGTWYSDVYNFKNFQGCEIWRRI